MTGRCPRGCLFPGVPGSSREFAGPTGNKRCREHVMTPGHALRWQLARAANRKRRHLSTGGSADGPGTELAAEQQYVTGLHRRLDDIRAHVVHRLDEALASSAHNPQAVGEREAAVQLYTQRIVALDAAHAGLCFGPPARPA